MHPTPPSQPRHDLAGLNAEPQPAPATLVVLIADSGTSGQGMARDLTATGQVTVHHAVTLAEARAYADLHTIDIAFVDLKLPDGDGLSFVDEMRRQHAGIGSIVVTGRGSYQAALSAMRAGACDYLPKPFTAEDLTLCVGRIIQRRADSHRVAERITRLKGLCRKLNKSRHEMSHQVDSICSDMTATFKDLQGRVKHAQVTSRFKTLVEHELDLERVLRRFLEVVLQEVGPTNAVVLLPSTKDEYAVGGYINYNIEKPSIDVMLSDLAQVAGSKIAEGKTPVGLADSAAIERWLGEPCGWLEGRAAVAFPCRDENNLMACVLLFRESGEAFAPAAIDALGALAPILAERLNKVVHIHHRLRPNDEALEHGDGSDPDEMKF